MNDLELMHASNITHDYPRHIHEAYCIAIMLRGAETHTCRGASYKAFPGSLMLLNADEAHSSKSVKTEYRVIHILQKTLSRIAFEVVGCRLESHYFANPVIEDSLSFRMLLNLHLKLEQRASTLEQESEFISFQSCTARRQINQREVS